MRRRGGGDPVKALLHRHRELCERAVDPLEIAAGLEAHGITDRTAARFRHRDVFSLAEELYARSPRGEHPGARPGRAPAGASAGARAYRGYGYALLPGALAFGAAAAGQAWAGPVAVAVTVAALVWPGRTAGGRFPYAAHLLAAALVAWAAHRHGAALAVALALAVAPGHLLAAAFAAGAGPGSAGAAPWRTSRTGPGPCSSRPSPCSPRPPRGRPRSPAPHCGWRCRSPCCCS